MYAAGRQPRGQAGPAGLVSKQTVARTYRPPFCLGFHPGVILRPGLQPPWVSPVTSCDTRAGVRAQLQRPLGPRVK